MRVYPLHYLSNEEFENLSTLICKKILGEGIIPFASGPDGGKDGKFIGKANCFPSSSLPWEGTIIIQAKHTTKENTSCSDSDFKNILKNDVIPAIKKLKTKDAIDFYLLFTNRKLTGLKDEEIEKQILSETEMPNVVIANEKIQQYLQEFSDIVRTAKLNDLLRPLEFDESDLKEIIIELHKVVDNSKIQSLSNDFTKVDIQEKNKLNNLSKTYFEDVVKKNYGYFKQIENFLSDPINISLKELYEDTISELNAKISLKRDEYAEFENLLEEFYDYIISNNSNELKGKKRLVRTLLIYMYCNCDIGKKR